MPHSSSGSRLIYSSETNVNTSVDLSNTHYFKFVIVKVMNVFTNEQAVL
jgi:hypothetical protein